MTHAHKDPQALPRAHVHARPPLAGPGRPPSPIVSGSEQSPRLHDRRRRPGEPWGPGGRGRTGRVAAGTDLGAARAPSPGLGAPSGRGQPPGQRPPARGLGPRIVRRRCLPTRDQFRAAGRRSARPWPSVDLSVAATAGAPPPAQRPRRGCELRRRGPAPPPLLSPPLPRPPRGNPSPRPSVRGTPAPTRSRCRGPPSARQASSAPRLPGLSPRHRILPQRRAVPTSPFSSFLRVTASRPLLPSRSLCPLSSSPSPSRPPLPSSFPLPISP
ncbi:wiskott-Aldrich syndrome protein homolog 1-like [Rhinolophus ferrumequinum]|uniref:wiskott-Aldrich syndrome protein homolog 1-like n=1 Tax=Rhinolophus ferrumequinum TaxID=59479 RepID=UPI00140FB8CC|nr:wiskott-Aldrich syndrome protein homolog 1-like [Rhinolophus ferrumequinum]